MSDDSDSKEYVVERILAKRTSRGVTKYLIKWKDCDSSENTWEPEQNLCCPELIRDFLNEKEAKKKWRPTSKRTSKRASDPAVPHKVEDVEKKPNDVDNNIDARVLRKRGRSDPTVNRTADQPPGVDGFRKGLVAEDILGITSEDGNLFFMVKWKNTDEIEMVESALARKHIPAMVIDFYERRIIWSSDPSE
ncbi:chromobox protein homolog 3-like [Wyeomyia smithii]|uniref:chromobox protein homolog 3-like n=1 Tax=Wyeomyia smithii TaxID=174621 RepID=UPI002467F812|nr:chromobox protein homolog 3-like [Wyeomyia smithii]